MAKISDHIKADHKQVYEKYLQIWSLGAFDEETPKKEKQALVVDLVKLMTVHANAEEALLYPILHHMPSHGKEAAQKSVAEHQDVELMLYQIERTDVNAPEFVNLVKRAVGTFKKHADDEEKRLLPAIDKFIEERAGNQMAKTIEEYLYTKQHASTVPHPAINRPGQGQKVAEDLLKTAEHEARFASAESAHLMAAVSGTTTSKK